MTTFLIYLIGAILSFIIVIYILKYSVKEELDEDDITDWAAAVVGISLLSWVGIVLAIGITLIISLVNCVSYILYNCINNK